MKEYIPKRNGKQLFVVMLALTLTMACSATVYAWFTAQRKISTITQINSPSALVIGAGAKESSVNIELGGINVEDVSRKKDFVFCVYSDESVENYKLQLAHTTNIQFVYTIYKAEAHETDPGNDRVEYVDEGGNAHYYTKNGGAVSGNYLNKSGTIANNTLHDKSYNDYDSVQKNAEPLYWQTDGAITPANSNLSGFIDYYILEISWNESILSDKETDIVYLTAGVA